MHVVGCRSVSWRTKHNHVSTYPRIRLRLIKATHCNLPLPRFTQSEEYVTHFVPENYQK